MTDKKITQLTALTGANAVAGDQLAIVDVSDTTMSASGTTKKIALSELQAAPLSAGTANGVAYLNGSKVLTTGSALTFNGTNLGVGTSSPNSRTEIVATNAGGEAELLQLRNTGTNGSTCVLRFLNSGDAASYTNGGFIKGIRSATDDNDLAFGTVNTERMRIDSAGNVGIGTSSPSASAILDAQSTTKGVRMPNMTTTQKNAIASPAAGLMVFDTTLAKLCVYSGAAWETITSL